MSQHVLIIAIIRCDRLPQIENTLKEIGVKGMTLSKVEGYGEYADTFSPDWMVCHSKIEIFSETDKATLVSDAIASSGHTGIEGDGVIAILPVARLIRIKDAK